MFTITFFWLLSFVSCTAYKGRSPLAPEELEVLRAAADAAMEPRHCRYVAVARTLRVREDQLSELLLQGIFQTSEENWGATRDLAVALWTSNPRDSALRISGAEQKLLGQRRSKLAHLASNEKGCKVQLSRVGWSSDRRHTLVYIGFREGLLPGAVLLELERQDGSWQAVREWASLETIVLD